MRRHREEKKKKKKKRKTRRKWDVSTKPNRQRQERDERGQGEDTHSFADRQTKGRNDQRGGENGLSFAAIWRKRFRYQRARSNRGISRKLIGDSPTKQRLRCLYTDPFSSPRPSLRKLRSRCTVDEASPLPERCISGVPNRWAELTFAQVQRRREPSSSSSSRRNRDWKLFKVLSVAHPDTKKCNRNDTRRRDISRKIVKSWKNFFLREKKIEESMLANFRNVTKSRKIITETMNADS